MFKKHADGKGLVDFPGFVLAHKAVTSKLTVEGARRAAQAVAKASLVTAESFAAAVTVGQCDESGGWGVGCHTN